MKYVLIFLFIFSRISFSQIIEKFENIYPRHYYNINSLDSTIYIFNESGIQIIRQAAQKFKFIREISFASKADLISEINLNKLLIKCSDTIYYYNISDPELPVFVNKWKAPDTLNRMIKFGSNFIFKYGNELKLVSISDDSIRVVYDIPFDTDIITYPYVILKYSNRFEFYKYTQSNPFYFERYLSDNYINNAAAGENLLVYRTKYSYDPNRPPICSLKVVDLANANFPYIFNYYLQLDYIYGQLESVSETFYSKRDNSEIEIMYLSGSPFGLYPPDYKVHLNTNKLFIYNYDSISSNQNFNLKSLFRSYCPVPFDGRILGIKDSSLYLLKNNSQNQFEVLDSNIFHGSIIPSDSFFLTKRSTSYIKYSLDDNKIIQSDSFKVVTSHYNFVDLGNYIYITHYNTFDLLKKTGNGSTKLIYTTNEFPKTSKAFKSDMSVFILDTTKGVVKYQISDDTIVTKIWRFGSDNKKYSLAVKENYLIILENNTQYLLNITASISNPVIIDSLSLPGNITYTDIIVTDNSVIVKGFKSNKAVLIKLEIENSKFKINYTINFDFNLDYSLTEKDKKFILFTSNEIYWISDSTLTEILSANIFLPQNNALYQNYPNPFNPVTNIRYTLKNKQSVTLNIYNVIGQHIAVLVNEEQQAGEYLVEFDASKYNLSSGIYIYELRTGDFAEGKKLIFLK